ncbi:MBL fold metallo-hydrolase [Flavisolibacter ginsenosidimutans]|uniref:MBL fold metallo-hydrolase n=1 Tax=Flavisolibacter ginsenosidimutans TaxID=661481 RepID=A0A5B8UNM4_9BACT|nr:MBL fold metallo-hydrolase [Flavisolibacter ginsenosidimutans]QEC58198.1 MBL fold metallo-hydrolase [Flavisolibacter ginsenosidimutans]
MQAPQNFNGKVFLNPVSTEMMKPGSFFRVMRKFLQKHPEREPASPLGPFSASAEVLQQLPSQTLRVTWLGHSTLLIEVDGKRFLTDPVWYNRVSPFRFLGPRRFFQNPLPLSHLPAIDAVLLSHDHYDHLDKQTLLALTRKNIPVITMLGVGRRLVNWGVQKNLITELDWWQETKIDGGFTVTATPSRHFSGRWLNDRFKTLWGAFVVKAPVHNIFFGADSGYYNGFAEIAERLGPFDIAMLEIGAYNEMWEAIHMGPEKAVQATLDLGRPLLLPIHWGTFSLAMHPWKEPVERLIAEAAKKDVKLILPAPGESVTVNKEPYNSQWWTQYR